MSLFLIKPYNNLLLKQKINIKKESHRSMNFIPNKSCIFLLFYETFYDNMISNKEMLQ